MIVYICSVIKTKTIMKNFFNNETNQEIICGICFMTLASIMLFIALILG